MRTRFRRSLSFSNVVSLIALFVALGGTSYAALELERDSVNSVHIKDGQVKGADLRRNSVDTTKVAQGSLRASDFAPGRAPQGPQGPPGSALAFAHVYGDGTVDAAQSKRVASANVTRVQPGVYCFRGMDFAPQVAVASADAFGGGAGSPATEIFPSTGPCAGAQASVRHGAGNFFVLFN